MRYHCLRVLSAFVLTVALSTAAGLAAGSPGIESTPVPLPPKPDFSSMQFMIGTWTCSNKSSRRPAAARSTQTYSMDPTGYWIDLKSTIDKSSWFPYQTTGLDKITYDSESRRWMDVFAGSLGDYALTWSTGWTGNTIEWHDAYFTPSMIANIVSESPFTITKVSDSKMTLHSTFKEKSGATITYNGVCNKT